MKFCTKCGTELKEGNKFCHNCGYNPEDPSTDPQNRIQEETPSTKKASFNIQEQWNRISKKHKLIGGGILGAIILIFIVTSVVSSMNSPERFVDQVIESIHERDVETFTSFLETEDGRTEIHEDQVVFYFSHLDNNPSVQDDLISELRVQAGVLADGGRLRHEENPPLLTLREKDGGFSSGYYLEPLAFYFRVQTNYEDTDIFINGELVDTTTDTQYNREFGPMMFGEYHLMARYEGEFANLEEERTLQLLNAYDNGNTVHLDLYGNDVTVDAAHWEHTRLLINGEDTGRTLEDMGGNFGPVEYDGSVSVQGVLDLPWGGTLYSEEVPVESGYIRLNFESPYDEEFSEPLIEIAHDFVRSLEDAYNANDAARLVHVGEGVFEQAEEMIGNKWENYHHYEVEYQLAEYGRSFENTQFNPSNEEFSFVVPMRLTMIERFSHEEVGAVEEAAEEEGEEEESQEDEEESPEDEAEEDEEEAEEEVDDSTSPSNLEEEEREQGFRIYFRYNLSSGAWEITNFDQFNINTGFWGGSSDPLRNQSETIEWDF